MFVLVPRGHVVGDRVGARGHPRRAVRGEAPPVTMNSLGRCTRAVHPGGAPGLCIRAVRGAGAGGLQVRAVVALVLAVSAAGVVAVLRSRSPRPEAVVTLMLRRSWIVRHKAGKVNPRRSCRPRSSEMMDRLARVTNGPPAPGRAPGWPASH